MGNREKILNELKQLSSAALINAANANVYSHPADYFETLEKNILRNIWLKTLPVAMPFTLPENYFAALPEVILDKVQLQQPTYLSGKVFSVPNNYFDNLSVNILNKIQNNISTKEELEQLSPLLRSVAKTNVYAVPDGYFEKFQPVKKSPAKVISISSKTHKFFNYAAAACVAFVLFGGGIFYINNKYSVEREIAHMNVQKAISQLSDRDINNYLANENPDFNAGQNSINEQDINMKTLLDNTSDEDINNYLKENPEPSGDAKGS